MASVHICSAIGTPLTDQEELHSDGLRAHLEAQRSAAIPSILVAGSMGVMPLLSDQVYRDLVTVCVQEWSSGEILVGVGDVSWARTKHRLDFSNEFKIDGAVVLAPFFMKFSEHELIDYFCAVADYSRAPVYLYDLPQRTGVSLSIETVLRLSQHPNIAGIKCSGDVGQARRLCDALQGSNFRVMLAHALLVDVLIQAGFKEHVDGIFSIAPKLIQEIAAASASGERGTATFKTGQMNDLLVKVVEYGVFPAMTVLLNSRGIPGNFAPKPFRQLPPEVMDRLLAEPAVRTALA